MQVNATKAAVAAYHKIRHLPPPPFNDPAMAYFWEGLRKECDNVVKGKEAITKPQLIGILKHWAKVVSPASKRNQCMAVMQFYAMRRVSEILNLTILNVEDLGVGRGVVLKIPRQKNDKYGRGMEVPLPEKTLDGVAIGSIIRAYLDLPGVRTHEGPLLRYANSHTTHRARTQGLAHARLSLTCISAFSIVCSMTRGQQGLIDKPLSRDVWNKAVREAFEKVFPDVPSVSISSHSFRKGGFTAAKLAGMAHDCAIDAMGHSHTSSTWLAYMKRSREERMAEHAKM